MTSRVYNAAMTLDEHLACPNCGYDQYGVGELRCPECGFRYDAEALRSLASDAEWGRLASAQDVFFRSLVAGLLAWPILVSRLGFTGLPAFGLLSAAFLGMLAVWFVSGPMNPESVYARKGRGEAICVGIILSVLMAVPTIAWFIGAVALLAAWYVRIADWPTLAPAANIRSPELRRLVARHSRRATTVLIAATVIVLTSILG